MSKFLRDLKYNLKKQYPELSGMFRELFWFPPIVHPSIIGYGPGPYSKYREWRHKRANKKIYICLLTGNIPEKLKKHYLDLHVFWINERSKVCHVYVDEPVENADLIWVYTQDPIAPDWMERLRIQLSRAHPNIPVINRLENYNFYHQADAFPRLEKAGVNVPRNQFSEKDMGKTKVVHKKSGVQSAPKTCELYQGPVDGYRTFEFIDYQDENGLYPRYRAFYILGLIRPSKILKSNHWNSCMKNTVEIDYAFQITSQEEEQLRWLAKTSGLDYFAVDYLRRNPDKKPVFVDINVFPTIMAKPASTFDLGYRGYWHTFDTRQRLGIPEPMGQPFWKLFDEALLNFVNSSRKQQADSLVTTTTA